MTWEGIRLEPGDVELELSCRWKQADGMATRKQLQLAAICHTRAHRRAYDGGRC